jgi:hypothetical protein
MYIRNGLLKLKATSSGAFDTPARLFWFVAAAMVAPFALLLIGGDEPNRLPWSFWAIVTMGVLTVISIGFVRFTRVSNEAECISISPERR